MGLILSNTGIKIVDPIASIIISLIILIFSLKLLVKIVRNLLDYIPREVTEKIIKILKDFPEIKSINKLKVHEVGNIKFINIEICLKNILYSSRIEKIKEKIRNVRSVYIHIEDARDSESWNDITEKSSDIVSDIKKVISSYTSPDTCHNFTILEKKGVYNLAFHCRLGRGLNIREAHSIVTEMENDIKNKFKNINEVSIHVKPNK